VIHFVRVTLEVSVLRRRKYVGRLISDASLLDVSVTKESYYISSPLHVSRVVSIHFNCSETFEASSKLIATNPFKKWYFYSEKVARVPSLLRVPSFNCVVHWELEQLFLKRIPLLKGYCSDQFKRLTTLLPFQDVTRPKTVAHSAVVI